MINLVTKDWTIENVDTVLFDKDGTFIDLHYFWGKMTEMRVQEVIKRFGMDENLFADLCICLGYDTKTGRMLQDGITAMYSRSKIIELFKTDLWAYGTQVSEEELTQIFDDVSEVFYKDMHGFTKPIDAALNLIKELKSKGIKTGIVTGDAIESTLMTLKHFGWMDLFDVVIGRGSCPYTKESGEPTKMALEILNSSPTTSVMIGDTPMDYISAIRAGITRTILVTTGQVEREILEKSNKYVLSSLSEIMCKINPLFGS